MQQYIIGNWKMNGTKAEAQKLASGFLKRIQEATRPLPHIILCPSYPYLVTVVDILKNSPIDVGAQDCHHESKGAYTGDVSILQLADVGCKYVIIGHSERRHHHHEGSSLIRKKIESALQNGLRPILCLGENAEERANGRALSVIEQQLMTDLPDNFSTHDVLIAYEPLWAIGTGKIASASEIEEVLGFIKHTLSSRMSGGGLVPTLYGGSVSSQNAAEILSIPHVDGLLVGGASLKLDEFWDVINASKE